MYSKSISLAVALLIMQVHGTISCTFIDQKNEFVADVKYAMLKKDKDWCLLTCYEEDNCIFAEYNEGVCTIFEDGETHQSGGNNTYKLDCQLKLPACPHCLPLAEEVEFQNLELETTQSKTRMLELLAKETAALTIIYMFNRGGVFTFTKTESAFTDGTPPQRSLVFAKNPQPECVSVPVFQKASQHKLYFGGVYNVTGYEFLDAYAFTTYCVCEGNCCGQLPITKNSIGDSIQGLRHDISDAEQVLYIANMIKNNGDPVLGTDSTVCIDSY